MSTVYLTNFASHRTTGCHGPGRVWSIMRLTPKWAWSTPKMAGWLEVLTPSLTDLLAIRGQQIDVAQYRTLYDTAVRDRLAGAVEFGLRGWSLTPGELGDSLGGLVQDGDTLCCTCSREAAAQQACHRVYAAQLLHDAGWRVVLDGVDFQSASQYPDSVVTPAQGRLL